MSNIYVDFSGRFDSDLFIDAVKGIENDFLTIWKQNEVIRRTRHARRKITKKGGNLV